MRKKANKEVLPESRAEEGREQGLLKVVARGSTKLEVAPKFFGDREKHSS